jgi:hypothetical protein
MGVGGVPDTASAALNRNASVTIAMVFRILASL